MTPGITRVASLCAVALVLAWVPAWAPAAAQAQSAQRADPAPVHGTAQAPVSPQGASVAPSGTPATPDTSAPSGTPATPPTAADIAALPVAGADTAASPRADTSFPTGFRFGTYGRVGFSGDLRGAPGRTTNMVTHGARLMEGSYAETDLGYGIRLSDGFAVRVLMTLAFFDEFFHFTGNATQAIAMRNLYAEASGFLKTDLKVWVGSRMYRGDDIYLLDWWPLDALNTLGGGFSWDSDHKAWRVQAHVGVNRLKDSSMLRTVSVPSTYGADTITLMERQRVIASAKVTWFGHKLAGDLSLKVSLYGEYHRLPKGTLRYSGEYKQYFEEFALAQNPDLMTVLPADDGGVIGAQIGLWGFGPDSHVNLFARYAWGLAAYGEWGVPWGVALDRTSSGAKEFVLAASMNWENHDFGLMATSYGRLFVDADRNRYDLDDYWEGITVVRPAWFATTHFHVAAEVSHQWKVPRGIGPNDNRHHDPQVVQMSLLPALSLGRGMYRRPEFRVVYSASWLNADARNLFPKFDERRDRAWQHYLGLQVEWWLDSSSYP